jgi:hypothetical protein
LQSGPKSLFAHRSPPSSRWTRVLRDNGFGYLKVDYNGTIGFGVDRGESPGEGLRQHLEGMQNFFLKLREEIPDLFIGRCLPTRAQG